MLVIALVTVAGAAAGASDVGSAARASTALQGAPTTLHAAVSALTARGNPRHPNEASAPVLVGSQSLLLDGQRLHQVHFEQRLAGNRWDQWTYTLDSTYRMVDFEAATEQLSTYPGHATSVDSKFALPPALASQIDAWTGALHTCGTYVYDYPVLDHAEIHTHFGQVAGYTVDLMQVIDPEAGQVVHIVREIDADLRVRDTRCVR